MKEEKDPMIVKIQKSSTSGVNANKGSCSNLAKYLNHEDEERMKLGLAPIPFITATGDEVSIDEVIESIDSNHHHLGKKDDKFYHVIISPSAEEIEALGKNEKEIYENGVNIVQSISDAYAKNFHREGLSDSSGLVLFWKPHFHRKNPDVIEFHIHGIISRNTKDIGGKIMKISPLTNHRDSEKGPIQGGFDRNAFRRKCQDIFDEQLNFDRKLEQTFEYQNAQKHGSAEEKEVQAQKLFEEKAEKLKASMTEGIQRRKNTIVTKKEVEEIATALGAGEELPAPKNENALNETLDIAEMATIVIKQFTSAASKTILELRLIKDGITIRIIEAKDGGVEDFLMIKQGKSVNAKDIVSKTDHVLLLNNWQRLTGEVPAFRLRERRAIEAAKRELAEKSERHHGGPKLKF